MDLTSRHILTLNNQGSALDWKWSLVSTIALFLAAECVVLCVMFRPRITSGEQLKGDEEQDSGPVIEFGGVTGRWMGSLHTTKNTVGIEARVNFEAYAGERTMSVLEIANSGTTVIYFNWKVLLLPVLSEYIR